MSVAILSRHPDGRDAWVLWRHPHEIICAETHDEISRALNRVEAVSRQGRYALGFVTYEAGPAFDTHFVIKDAPRDLPLVWFAVFDAFEVYDGGATYPSPCRWEPAILRDDYAARIEAIKSHIAAGETYQVNFTFSLQAQRPPLMKSLFMQLYRAQPSPFAMYIETPAFRIASVSPELFFQRKGRHLICEPMKGTCARAPHPDLDKAAGEALRHSQKNRAENLMIVDMIRNDLGRVATPGSVEVPRLFDVTAWPTLWQMTSTVTAESDASLADVFGALFPSASITGAPKLQTSGIIAQLETRPRGLYTGALGRINPGGDAEFAVAIRTAVQTSHPPKTIYGIGSGIVWDSMAGDEYDECLLKSRILEERVAPDFQLLETIRWNRSDGFILLDAHLARMALSAQHFNFRFDAVAAARQLAAAVDSATADDLRIRFLLTWNGATTLETRPLSGSTFCREPEGAPVIFAAIDSDRQDIASPFWYHKTTRREQYEAAQKRFPLADDVLLVSERGELMEFTSGNVVVRRDDEFLTPPLSSGLLPGVFRQHLLAQGRIRETVLHADELREEDDLYFINSVRGWRRVQYPHSPSR